MMRLLKIFYALCVSLLFAGCSSIMRPPSAAAFMDSYDRNDVVRNGSISIYAGNLDNGKVDRADEDSHYSHSEWFADVTVSSYFSSGFFTFGWGLQSLTPFFQAGFVSPYFGMTGWSNYATLFMKPFSSSDDNVFLNHYSGGGELIEQFPINDKWKLGFTEHISRNGRENYYTDELAMFKIPEAKPKFYTEIGGGFYVSHQMDESTKIALEFRYGRDIDEKRNRFAVTFDVWFGTSSIFGGNDVMRDMAEKNAKEMAETKSAYMDTSSLNVHPIKLRWFEIADSSIFSGTKFNKDEKMLVVSDGLCYEELQDRVWLKRSDDSLITPLPLNMLDYCEEAEVKKVGMGKVLLEGALSSLAALPSGNMYVVLGIGAGAAVATAVLMKNFGPDIPVMEPETCSTKHSVEELRNWLKQYPCGKK